LFSRTSLVSDACGHSARVCFFRASEALGSRGVAQAILALRLCAR